MKHTPSEAKLFSLQRGGEAQLIREGMGSMGGSTEGNSGERAAGKRRMRTMMGMKLEPTGAMIGDKVGTYT